MSGIDPNVLYNRGVLVVNVTSPMPGHLIDWPANIQDTVYAAMERYMLAHPAYTDWLVIDSVSGVDIDTKIAYARVEIVGKLRNYQ